MKTQLLFPILTLRSQHEDSYIHPWETDEIAKWCKKLGVNEQQLHDAVLETGSLYIKDIKHYLKDKGVLFSFKKLWQSMNLGAFIY